MACRDAPPIKRALGDATTARLRLRRFARDDLDDLATVFAKREVWEYPYGRGLRRDETEGFLDDALGHWQECGFGLWCAVERATQSVIGFVGLSIPRFAPELLPAVEVGWRLDPDRWGEGLATEGAGAALTAAFETLGLAEVCSLPQADNDRSVRVADRLGMRYERTVPLPATPRRGPVAARLYWMSRTDWEAIAPVAET